MPVTYIVGNFMTYYYKYKDFMLKQTGRRKEGRLYIMIQRYGHDFKREKHWETYYEQEHQHRHRHRRQHLTYKYKYLPFKFVP